MSRNKPKDLFQLIKSLNQSEKGYFKKYVSVHAKGEMIYLQLFDAIDKQKVYDEKGILQRIENYNSGLLKRIKHYLYNLILKSLDVYHSDSSIDDTIRKQLKYSELLYNKGLYEQSLTMIRKSKALAYKYDKYLLLPSLFQHESRIAFQAPGIRMLRECIAERHKETIPVFEKGRDIIEYLTLNLEMTNFQNSEGLNYTRGEGLKQLKAIIHSPYMQNENKASSYMSKNAFYGLSATYYLTIQQPHLALKYELKKIQLMESHPEQIKEFLLGYIVALNNYGNVLCRLKKFAAAEQSLEKLKALPDNFREGKKETNQVEIFSYYYCNLTDIYNKTGRFEKSLLLVNTIEKGIMRFGNKMREQMLCFIYFNMALAYFGQTQFKKSLFWLNKVLNKPQRESLQALHSITRLLNIMIHYELKRFDFLEYLIRSSQRYFETRKRLFKVEKEFLYFIGKKLPLIDTDAERIKAFKELKKKLMVIAKNPQESTPLKELDLFSWLDSKIENKSFSEVIKGKYPFK